MAMTLQEYSAEFTRDPYPFYARMRETGPVHRLDGGNEAAEVYWILSYEGVVTALSYKACLKQPPAEVGREPQPMPDLPPSHAHLKAYEGNLVASLLFLDPPAHTRLRSLVINAFTPRVMERLRPRVEEIAARLLWDAGKSGWMDVVSDFAFPLPATVIAELLGVPVEDRDRFRGWSNRIARGLDARAPKEAHFSAYLADLELAEYFDNLVKTRRARPDQDLISELIAAEEEGDRLSLPEILGMCTLLLTAGHETTTNLIGTGTYHLLRHPEQLEIVKEWPELWPTAVNELLRYDAPVQRTNRWLHEDIEIDGVPLPRGSLVAPVMGAANRDPKVFPDPDRLDVTRRENRHLAFGRGIHYCLGSSLAMLEAATAFRMLFEWFPSLRLVDDEPEWKPNTVVRGLVSLPVSFDSRAPR
ncbi:MAG: cytochrome P450 [Clostridia bacterium]|nr:cytochrome P450 [Clostridia bacterium]